MSSSNVIRRRRAALAFFLVVSSARLGAQVLEEIVVTAQKREQAAQDVGIAISVFTGEQLDGRAVTDSTDVSRMTPGVYVSSQDATRFQQFSIRGVTQNDFAGHAEAPNAVYIDEGYIASAQGQLFGMFDLDRVEVLKGPQGTLFGRNATGGLVHFITRRPTREPEGYSTLTYGSHDQVRFEGAVSGPLDESLSGRLSALFNRHDPIADNVFPSGQVVNPVTGAPMGPSPAGTNDLRDEDVWALRGQVLWDIASEANLLLSGFYSEQQVSEGQYQMPGSTAILDAQGRQVNAIFSTHDPNRCEAISAETGACLPLSFVDFEVPAPLAAAFPGFPIEDAVRPARDGDLLGFVDPDVNDEHYRTSVDFSPADADRFEVYGATGRLSWNLGDVALTSVSHYMHFDKATALDEGGAVPWTTVHLESEHDSFTQELRLSSTQGRARWVGGAYFLYIDATAGSALAFGADSPITFMFSPLVTGTSLGFDAPVFTNLKTRSYSLFGQIDFALDDTLSLIGGVRAIREEKQYRYESLLLANENLTRIDARRNAFSVPVFDPVSAPLGTYPAFADETDATLWAGKLQLELRPAEGRLFYAGINRGVKAGSFNSKLYDFGAPLPAEEIPYGEEVLTAYEVGFKTTLYGGTTQLNGSYYFYDYEDYQAFSFFGLAGRLIQNKDAEYHGMELDLRTRPFENWEFLLGASYIDATVRDVEIAEGIFRDVEPAFTPSVQVSGLVSYVLPARVLGGTTAVEVDASYVARSFSNLNNFDNNELPSYVLANARLGWKSADERWLATLFVKNLADRRYSVTTIDISTLCGCTEQAFGPPRWYGAQLRYSWQ